MTYLKQVENTTLDFFVQSLLTKSQSKSDGLGVVISKFRSFQV